MDIFTKLTLSVGLVIAGVMMILMSGGLQNNCNQSSDVEQCKQFMTISGYAGWGVAFSGLLLGFLTYRFTKGDEKPKVGSEK